MPKTTNLGLSTAAGMPIGGWMIAEMILPGVRFAVDAKFAPALRAGKKERP